MLWTCSFQLCFIVWLRHLTIFSYKKKKKKENIVGCFQVALGKVDLHVGVIWHPHELNYHGWRDFSKNNSLWVKGEFIPNGPSLDWFGMSLKQFMVSTFLKLTIEGRGLFATFHLPQSMSLCRYHEALPKVC
jgi:hypothetical protein